MGERKEERGSEFGKEMGCTPKMILKHLWKT
jgi:hypothetical protein